MSIAPEQYPYVQVDPTAPAASLSPYLPISLSIAHQHLAIVTLVDSGAAVNVLPYDAGLQLGLL